MAEAVIGSIECAKWNGDRPSVERVEVVTVRRPGTQGVGSNVLPKFGRDQTVETVTYSETGDAGTLAAAIRALEGTIVIIQWNGINFSSSLSTKHLVKSVEIVRVNVVAKVVGLTYAGSVYVLDPGVATVARWTFVPVAA